MTHYADRTVSFSSDNDPGIRREWKAGRWSYHDCAASGRGRAVRSAKTIARIEALAVPPAWTDVWICRSADGHLQATGRDSRGRKQYRYHEAWTADRDSTKFDSLYDFGVLLPRIRRKVARDLALQELTRERVLAAVVRLMDRTFIRVGGERYRRDNNSFGATTLRNRHAEVDGETIFFDFRGKSGKRHQIDVRDKRIASVVRRCLDLPGQLFQYRELGEYRGISAADVNGYLQEISGKPITSKDFRTWGGTTHAAVSLDRHGRADTPSARRRQMVHAVRVASKVLGNTPAVCRRSYIHPVVLASHESGLSTPPLAVAGLRQGEKLVLALLKPSC
jgi:DNA topoisomerase I